MNKVRSLLENGADVNAKNSKSFTLLMHSVKVNNADMVETILSFHPKINIINGSGLSALYYAVENKNIEIVKLLVTSGANITDESYMLALQNSYHKIVEYFDRQDPNKQIFLKDKMV